MNEGPGEQGSSGVAERLEQAVHVCRFERGVMQLVRCGFVGSGVPLGASSPRSDLPNGEVKHHAMKKEVQVENLRKEGNGWCEGHLLEVASLDTSPCVVVERPRIRSVVQGVNLTSRAW